MDINTDIDILLAKYFSGEASVKELDMLDDWLAESTENESYFDQLTSLYEKSAQVTSPYRVDTSKALDKFEQYMQQSAPLQRNDKVKTSNRKISIYLQIAAAIAVLIAAALFFMQTKEDESSIHIASAETPIEHLMPDNSVILLSQNTSITYNQSYGEDNKSISLEGKASFDIGEKGSGRMRVSVGETFIEDIGTVFTVDGYEDNQYISVNVEDGIVLFYTADNSGLNLYEGETGYFNKSNKQFSKHVGGKNVGYDQIIFEATPLNKVIERLSQQFNVTITLADSSLGSKQITVSFRESEGVEHILQIVAETLLLNFQYQNGEYILFSL